MKKIVLLIGLMTALSGCEKLFFKKDKASDHPRENFEYLWKEIHDKYSYFAVKNVDWDAIYTEYSAQVSDDMTDDALFTLLGKMLNELRDGHSNLVSPFNVSRYQFDKLNQDNFDWRLVQDHYLPQDYYISGPFAHDFLLNTNQQIGYIRFADFDGSISDDNLDFALQRYAGTKGIILDIRENGGGYIGDVFRLLSRFTDGSKVVYYSRIKVGTGYNDFSDPQPATLDPHNGTRYTGKVVLLTDREHSAQLPSQHSQPKRWAISCRSATRPVAGSDFPTADSFPMAGLTGFPSRRDSIWA